MVKKFLIVYASNPGNNFLYESPSFKKSSTEKSARYERIWAVDAYVNTDANVVSSVSITIGSGLYFTGYFHVGVCPTYE